MKQTVLFVLACVLLGLLVAAPGFAQSVCTESCVITRGEPFTIAWDHDGLNTTEYRLYVNGTFVPETIQFANGVVTIPNPTGVDPGIVAGTYTLVLGAVNPQGEARSAPLTVIVQDAATVPNTPTNGRVTKQQ